MVTINGYLIDVAEAEEHTFDNEVTSHPVEKGADIADHVRARPIMVTVEGVVTDTPIGVMADLRDPDALPSEEAFATLLDMRDRREPVTIETSLDVFENMVLQSLSMPRGPDTGDAFRFRATFLQITLVTNERTTIRVAVPRAKKKKKKGPTPSPDTETKGIPKPPGKARDVLGRLLGIH